MTEQKTGETPRSQLEAKLTLRGLEVITQQLTQIFTEPIKEDLIRVVPKGTLANWERMIELADIVFNSETRTLEQKDKKPWQYKIAITANDRTERMNARMVGQALQRLAAFAELSRTEMNPHDRLVLLDDGLQAIKMHLHLAMWKDKRKTDELSDGQSIKSSAEKFGITFAQGLDGASPEQILHILQAIKEQSESKPDTRINNQQVREKVLRPK